jgi:hypothetical protein
MSANTASPPTQAKYRAHWFSHGSAISNHVFVQKLVFMRGYCRAVITSDLTLRQRLAYLRPIIDRALYRAKTSLGYRYLKGIYTPSVESKVRRV